MVKIIINNKRDRQRLREKYQSVKPPYMSKALSFQLNSLLALRIRKDALSLPSVELVGKLKE
jgi:hypothetical protein